MPKPINCYPDLRRRRGRAAVVPGVRGADEGPREPRAEDLQQAGGLVRLQALRQAGGQASRRIVQLYYTYYCCIATSSKYSSAGENALILIVQ